MESFKDSLAVSSNSDCQIWLRAIQQVRGMMFGLVSLLFFHFYFPSGADFTRCWLADDRSFMN